MSYDLVFWRFTPGERRSSQPIYDALVRNESPPELAELPIEAMLKAILDAYPEAVREPNGFAEWIDWVSADQAQSFQVEWSPKHVIVSCRGLPGEAMNRFVDIAGRFDCPLYDPQTAERFDSHTAS